MDKDKFTKILVVEDNLDDSFMLFRQLQKAQIDDHVTFIENGREALAFLLENHDRPPFALFLDLRLPDLDGIEILKRIKQESGLEEMPVIVMSGTSNQKDMEECRRLGAVNFLSKPINISTFIRSVTQLLPKPLNSNNP